MLDDLFMQILDMTKVSSAVIAIVMLSRLALKRAPKIFSYALWGIVLLRLLCPFSIETSVSIVPEVTSVSSGYSLSDESISAAGAGEAAYRAAGDMINGRLGVQHIRTTELAEDGSVRYVMTDWWDVWILFGQYIWLAGMAVMLVYSGISYLKIRKKAEVSIPLRDNIYIADDLESPCVIGFQCPNIYLPSGLAEKEQEYVILHEQHHIRRLDHIIKGLAFLALTIHWFNPLVWAAFVLACKDMEMSCDEAVIRKLGEEVRADYSASLLSLATGHRMIAGMPLAFGEGDTKGRIKNLANWKKPAFWVILIAVILCIVLAVCLLTDPSTSNGTAGGITYSYGTVVDSAVSAVDEESREGRSCITIKCSDSTDKLFWMAEGCEKLEDLVGEYVVVRSRVEEETGLAVATMVTATDKTCSETLDDAIRNAILEHNGSQRYDGMCQTASFVTLHEETTTAADPDEPMRLIETGTVYGIAYYQVYRLEDGLLVAEGGSHVPVVMTFRYSFGEFILTEYWEPRDGSYYDDDIKAKFSKSVWPDTQTYILKQKIESYDQALEYYQLDRAVLIDTLITALCEAQRFFDSPEALIASNDLDLQMLVYYSRSTLEYCFGEFMNGGQTDLRGQIMALVCQSVLRSWGENPGDTDLTGQAWFDSYSENGLS